MAESGQAPNQNNAVYNVERGTYRRIFNESTTTIGMPTAEADRALFDTAPLQSARRGMELNNTADQAPERQQEIQNELDAAEVETLATQSADVKNTPPQPAQNSAQNSGQNNSQNNDPNSAMRAPNVADNDAVDIEPLRPIFEAQAKTPHAANTLDAAYEAQHGHEGLRILNAMETLAERMGTTAPVNNSLRNGQALAEQKEKERTAQAIRYSQYIRQLEENVRQNQLAVEQAQRNLDEANKRVAEAEARVERAEEGVAKAEARVERLTEDVAALDQKIDLNQQEQAALRTQEAEQVAKIDDLEEQATDTEQKIEEIGGKVAVVEQTIAANDDVIADKEQEAEQHAAVAEKAEQEQTVAAQDNSELARRISAMESNAPKNPENGDALFVDAKGNVVNKDGQKQDINKDQIENPNALISFEKYNEMTQKRDILAEKYEDKADQADRAAAAAERAQDVADKKAEENQQLGHERDNLKEMQDYYKEGLKGLKQEIKEVRGELRETRNQLKHKIDEGKDLVREREQKVEELGIAKQDLGKAKQELLDAKDNLSARQKEQLEAIEKLEAAQKKLEESKQELKDARSGTHAELKEMREYRSWLKDDNTRDKILKGEISREEILQKTPSSLREYVSAEMDKGAEKFAQRDAVGIEAQQQVASVSAEQTATNRVGTSAAKSDISTGGLNVNNAFAAAASPNQPTAATPQMPGAEMDMTEQTRRASMSGQSMTMGMA